MQQFGSFVVPGILIRLKSVLPISPQFFFLSISLGRHLEVVTENTDTVVVFKLDISNNAYPYFTLAYLPGTNDVVSWLWGYFPVVESTISLYA